MDWTTGVQILKQEEIHQFFETYRLAVGFTRPGMRLNHPPPSSAEVKTEWIYNSTSPICLHGMYSDNFNYVTENDYLLTLLRPPDCVC
jgi:hypothetical protein